jgi:transposase
MPPSLLEWVPEDHLAWTILASVEEMDLGALYADYRPDGRGRPAYDPKMMVALLLYAYAKGNRSSRGIERACSEDGAYRVICSNHAPDHSTIAEFRVRHERALADLFGEVLGLCGSAGLVRVGVVAIDGTKVSANASIDANSSYEQIAREILEEGRADRRGGGRALRGGARRRAARAVAHARGAARGVAGGQAQARCRAC